MPGVIAGGWAIAGLKKTVSRLEPLKGDGRDNGCGRAMMGSPLYEVYLENSQEEQSVDLVDVMFTELSEVDASVIQHARDLSLNTSRTHVSGYSRPIMLSVKKIFAKGNIRYRAALGIGMNVNNPSAFFCYEDKPLQSAHNPLRVSYISIT